jgi:PilZ domain
VFTRAARVPTAPIEARLGSAFGRLTNVSTTGALVRTDVPLETGHFCPMIVNLPKAPVSLSVRVVRSEALKRAGRPGTIAGLPQYLVAVRFTELSALAKRAIATLCYPGRTERD